MAQHVCPWWLGYWLASPLRRLTVDPASLLRPFVGEGMTVLEPGPGMGFFTLELARLVGPKGRVVAIDIQQKMLNGLVRKAGRAGLAGRVEARLAGSPGLGVGDLEGKADFVLAFAMVHEVPGPGSFFTETASCLKHGATMLFCEPAGHVPLERFERSVALARAAGLRERSRPSVRSHHAALLMKT